MSAEYCSLESELIFFLPARGIDMTNEVATRTCLGCGSDVSRDAAQCPHCGRVLKKPPRTTGDWLFVIFSVFMAVWFVYAIASGGQGMIPISQTMSVGAGYPMIAVTWIVVALIYRGRRRRRLEAAQSR